MRQLRWMMLCMAAAVMSGAAWARPYAVFYMDDSTAAAASFARHADKVDLLIPTWYEVDGDGLLSGGPNENVMQQAQHSGVDVMPIVALFDADVFHDLATSRMAQTEMNAAMIRECKAHGYTGFQIDFEHLDWTDRDLLSALVARSAQTLHSAGLKLSIATIPNAPGYVTTKDGFEGWMFRQWRGVYDLAALSKSADWISLMTYDQHTRWTMPGPVGGWAWTVDNLKYALQFVPRDKLLLGIPLYGYHWYADAPAESDGDETPNLTADQVGAEDAMEMAKTYRGGRVDWDADDHTPYFYFYRQQMREWVYFTNARAFADRVELTEQNGIKGFCAWVLGTEDPQIWTRLPNHPAHGPA